MCQAIADGGTRCPVHRHETVVLMRIAERNTDLDRRQIETLFVDLRREGRGTELARGRQHFEELIANIRTQPVYGDNDTSRQRRQRALDAALTAEGRTPDGATMYAQQQLIARAEIQDVALTQEIRRIADLRGIPIAEARMEYKRLRDEVPRGRGVRYPDSYTTENIEAAKAAGLPYDAPSVEALHQMEVRVERGQRVIPSHIAIDDGFSYGYDFSSRRLEITLEGQNFAYRNVRPEVFNGSSPQQAMISWAQIRSNNALLGDNAYETSEDAEREAYTYRCESCGRFRALTRHSCPEFESRQLAAVEMAAETEQLAREAFQAAESNADLEAALAEVEVEIEAAESTNEEDAAQETTVSNTAHEEALAALRARLRGEPEIEEPETEEFTESETAILDAGGLEVANDENVSDEVIRQTLPTAQKALL